MMITDLNKELWALFSFFDIVFVIIIAMLKYWSCKSTNLAGYSSGDLFTNKNKGSAFCSAEKKKKNTNNEKNTASQLLEKMLQTKNLTMDRFPSFF